MKRWQILLLVAIVLLSCTVLAVLHLRPTSRPTHAAKTPVASAAATQPAAVAPTPCATIADGAQQILVSISKRHLWACAGTTLAYSTPVVTGMENIPADLTPTGTYHIYAKYTDQYLRGSDATGSWDDYVSYWMPFLDNQYGTYGFHDATWRKDSDFGNIDPYSSNASHGCVELPLVAAKWLYNWAPIGTEIVIST